MQKFFIKNKATTTTAAITKSINIYKNFKIDRQINKNNTHKYCRKKKKKKKKKIEYIRQKYNNNTRPTLLKMISTNLFYVKTFEEKKNFLLVWNLFMKEYRAEYRKSLLPSSHII